MRKNKNFQDIRDWAENKGIYDSGDPNTQFVKLIEEVGELAVGLLKNDDELVKDSIGDAIVVLTNLAELYSNKIIFAKKDFKAGFTIEDCIGIAWEEIKDRKGKMVDGTFVKDK